MIKVVLSFSILFLLQAFESNNQLSNLQACNQLCEHLDHQLHDKCFDLCFSIQTSSMKQNFQIIEELQSLAPNEQRAEFQKQLQILLNLEAEQVSQSGPLQPQKITLNYEKLRKLIDDDTDQVKLICQNNCNQVCQLLLFETGSSCFGHCEEIYCNNFYFKQSQYQQSFLQQSKANKMSDSEVLNTNQQNKTSETKLRTGDSVCLDRCMTECQKNLNGQDCFKMCVVQCSTVSQSSDNSSDIQNISYGYQMKFEQPTT